LLWIMLAGLVLLTGCRTKVGKATTGAVDWVRSSLRVTVDEPVDDVNEAVVKACRSLDLKAVSSETDLASGEFVWENAKEETITVNTQALSLNTTEIRIQVGAMGDKMQSEILLDRIKDKL